MWLIILSDQLLIVALVSLYLTKANQTRAAPMAINLSPEGHIRY